MRSIQIYDTTLRDGSQGEGVNFSLYDKMLIAKRLDEAGFDYIEGGYPLSNEKDAEFFHRLDELDLKKSTICAFGMTRRRGTKVQEDPGIRALVESNAPAVTIVGKAWDFHVSDVLRISPEENLAMIADSVKFLADAGREVLFDAEHFFDGWRANPQYAAQAIRTAVDAGATTVVLCDTNGGTMPEEIARYIKAAIEAIGRDDVGIGVHCHNDSDLAVANTLAGIDAGATQAQGTINGFGERCGNADLISVIANLSLKKGYRTLDGRGVEQLTDLSRYVYETANLRLRPDQPYVGQSAFAHKGGMHVHAVSRATSSYEHVDPQRVGNERRILVSELSGRANIVALTTKHHLDQDPKLMDQILARVVELENQGYQFEAAEASFDLLVRKIAGTFTPHFERIKYHVEVGTSSSGELVTEGTVKLRVGDEIRHEVAEGDGPVNALDAAMRKALNGRFPVLRGMRLVDYKVRVVNSEAGTAARIRVMIESEDEEGVWGTIGVHENIIEASWIALVDAIEFKLYKDETTRLDV